MDKLEKVLKYVDYEEAIVIGSIVGELREQLQQSQHRERVLEEKFQYHLAKWDDEIIKIDAKEREVIKERDVWCEKCLESERRERVLREALEWYADPRNEESGDLAIEALEASK
jgi:hypothetical protein